MPQEQKRKEKRRQTKLYRCGFFFFFLNQYEVELIERHSWSHIHTQLPSTKQKQMTSWELLILVLCLHDFSYKLLGKFYWEIIN